MRAEQPASALQLLPAAGPAGYSHGCCRLNLLLLLSGVPRASTGLALGNRWDLVLRAFSRGTCWSLFKCPRFALSTLEIAAPQPQRTAVQQRGVLLWGGQQQSDRITWS